MTYKDAYSKDKTEYARLVKELKRKYGKVTLSEEYGFFTEENLIQFLIRLSRFKFAAKMIKRSDSVLEIGCGSGLGTNFLGQYCRKVHGIDVKEEEIENALSITRRKNVTFEVGDFFNMPPTLRCDVIVALDVIEHMTQARGQTLIQKTARHLHSSGMLIIGSPSIYSFKYQGSLSKAAHIKLYDQEELRSLIEKHFTRTVAFSMNDEIVHTGFSKMAWYYFVLAFGPKGTKK